MQVVVVGGAGAVGGKENRRRRESEQTHPYNLSQVTVDNPDGASRSCQKKKRSSCGGVGTPLAHKKLLFWLQVRKKEIRAGKFT